MAFLYINTGTSANKGDGDSLRTAFTKINYNFSQVSVSTSSTVAITDQNDNPLIEIKALSGSFTLPADTVTPITLFEIDKTKYRSASIDIFAEDTTANTQDAASGYVVTWNSSTSQVLGTGIVSLKQDGTTGNANWDLSDTNISGNTLQVRAYNVSGSTDSNSIAWRAKVSLFRL